MSSAKSFTNGHNTRACLFDSILGVKIAEFLHRTNIVDGSIISYSLIISVRPLFGIIFAAVAFNLQTTMGQYLIYIAGLFFSEKIAEFITLIVKSFRHLAAHHVN
jgi:hypothetical protein